MTGTSLVAFRAPRRGMLASVTSDIAESGGGDGATSSMLAEAAEALAVIAVAIALAGAFVIAFNRSNARRKAGASRSGP